MAAYIRSMVDKLPILEYNFNSQVYLVKKEVKSRLK